VHFPKNFMVLVVKLKQLKALFLQNYRRYCCRDYFNKVLLKLAAG